MEQSNLEERIQTVESELSLIKLRNQRVELEKAWEVSLIRKGAILALTYFIASFVLYLIEVDRFWLNALIPTLGYFMSTLSVAWLKARWMGKK